MHVYPEWDYKRGIYRPQHARVLERVAEEAPAGTGWKPGPGMDRRIRAVRRQFEALRPKREVIGRQLDGHEIDMDAVIRSRAEIIARWLRAPTTSTGRRASSPRSLGCRAGRHFALDGKRWVDERTELSTSRRRR